MKIVILGPAHPYRGGIADYNERLAEELTRQKHEVQIYTFTLQYPKFLFPGKTQYRKEPKTVPVPIHRKINTMSPINWYKTGKEVQKMVPDLVIVRYWIPFLGPALGTILRQIKKNHFTKIIAITDNVLPHEKRPGDRTFTRYFLKPVDAFLAMSKTVMKELSVYDTQKPRIFSPHPLYDHFGKKTSRENALSKLQLDSKFNYILFFGLIRPYKGLDLLLEAFASKHLSDCQYIKLIIAGEVYGDIQQYKSLISSLGLQGRVIFHSHFIPESQVRYYFSAANIVVQPYKTATQSGVTQIAYHFEKPMIVTNVGGLKELCPNGKVGFVVPPNVDQIARAIRNFFDHPELATKFEANLKLEKKRFSWAQLVDNLFELYKKS